MFSWFQKFPKKSFVDIQLCTLQNAFSREAAFQISRTKYQIRSLEELINPSIGTMSMRCHEKFPVRSINPFSRWQFLWRSLCKTRFMKDAAVYRFAIEGSFDQISKHNDKNDQKDVDIILGALSPDWDGVDVWHYNIAALSLKLLNIFLDVIVTGSSPDWDCADVRCCAAFCHCPQWTWPVTGKYHSLLKIILSILMISKIFEISYQVFLYVTGLFCYVSLFLCL